MSPNERKSSMRQQWETWLVFKKYHTGENYQICEKYYTSEIMLFSIQILLASIYTQLGETCHQYSIMLYQYHCSHYYEDQSIHIFMELLVEVIFVYFLFHDGRLI